MHGTGGSQWCRQWALPESDTYFQPLLDRDPRGFQIDHLELALSHCMSFRMAVDGGAHIGTWTKALAARFDTVLAFEPARDTFECLAENTAGLAGVCRYHMALGAAHGAAEVIDDPTRPGNTGARYLRIGAGRANAPVVPLDAFGLWEVDFLKLDVEGYELHALTGASGTLQRSWPVVMIECKKFKPPRYGMGPEVAVAFLRDLGYREAARARNDVVFVHA